MSDRTFKLEVITPDRVVLSDDQVVSIVAPGVEGYLGVMANHAPLMTELTIGQLDIRRADGTADDMAVSGGFMEVYENKVTVLAETAEMGKEIDTERARAALQRAEERIKSHVADVDIERARIALMKAMNRLDVARKHG